MLGVDSKAAASFFWEDSKDELSNEQIQELLSRAEANLKQSHSPSDERSFKVPQFAAEASTKPCIESTKSSSKLDTDFLAKQMDMNPREAKGPPESKPAREERKKREKQATAGPQWYNLPKTKLTPELKRDLQLLRMRSALDPKRHYRREERGKPEIPAFSQVGTIIEPAAEFFSSRLQNKERHQTLADEVLATEKGGERFRKAYLERQSKKTSGKKEHYKALKAKRTKRR